MKGRADRRGSISTAPGGVESRGPSKPDPDSDPALAEGIPARRAAAIALLRVESEGAFVSRLDPEAAGDLDPRERRQATEYLGGITRHRRWLDFLIDKLYHRGIDQLDTRPKIVLRMGLYDLLLAHRPAHAAVSQAVELCRVMGAERAAGLVNAVLREALRRGDALPEPETGDPAEDLAIRHSHPTWMVRRWLERFGPEETLALLQWNNARPRHSLRINLRVATPAMLQAELDRLEIRWRPGRWLDEILWVELLQPVLAQGLHRRGWCAVQDEAAALVVAALDPQPGERIIDGCAAPGSKALFAAARMDDRGELIAVDRHARRLALLEKAAAVQMVSIVRTVAHDFRLLPEAEDESGAALVAPADRVLIDAPCSGSGVLSKRADLRWRRGPESLPELTALQDALLDAGARLTRPGGLLVYSTCSIEPEENEDRVAAFLGRHPDFDLEPLDDLLSSELLTEAGCYQSLPHRHRMDGAFAARLRRRG